MAIHDCPLFTKYKKEGEDSGLDLAVVLTDVLAKLGSGLTISSVSLDEVRDRTAGNDNSLSITNVQANGSTYTRPFDGSTHSANTVVQYQAAGGKVGTVYEVDFRVAVTGAAPLIVRQPIKVE